MSIQLVQTQQGATGPISLSSTNASDLDSSNFLWRKEYHPGVTNGHIETLSIFGAGGDMPGTMFPHHDIDIRVKRRFDRSQWALTFNTVSQLGAITEFACAFQFRGLFLTSGGI